MKSTTKWIWILAIALAPILTTGCGSGASTDGVPDANINAKGEGDTKETDGDNGFSNEGPVSLRADNLSSMSPAKVAGKPTRTIVIKTNLGDITVELNRAKARRTVDHFLDNYVDLSFYDGTVFHYVQDGAMVIGGGFDTDLKEKPHRHEVGYEGDNGLKNVRGTIAMNRHPDLHNSATCQFFFNLTDNPSFDHVADQSKESIDTSREFPTEFEDKTKYGYTVFGKVTAGIEIVDQIGKVNVHDTANFVSTPVTPVIIESIRRVE